MQASNAPSKIQKPFADNGDKQSIPVASQVGVADGRASYTDGFPPLTRTPIVAGGVPPFGTDMNGILNAITAIQKWQSAGGQFTFDAGFAAAIGGYPKGATLQKADGSGTWLCTADNNSSNPDSGGGDWQDFSAGRLVGLQVFKTSGAYTPTPGTKSIVVRGIGGSGASGGTAATGAGQCAAGASGGNGAYGEGRFTSGFTGLTVTIGAGGAAGAAGAAGGAGGATSLGSIFVLPGGIGGQLGTAVSSSAPVLSGLGANNSGTIVGANIVGYLGALSASGFVIGANIVQNGIGSPCPFGAPAASIATGTAPGRQGFGYGVGSAGAAAFASSAAQVGAAGLAGILIIEEYA